MVRGASPVCGDESVVAIVEPADEVTESDPMNVLTRIPLVDIVFQNTYDAETEFGILHTSVLSQTTFLTTGPLFIWKEISGGGSKRKKRNYYWRSVIRRGTDLSSLGVSLKFDNASKHKDHFSLIPNQRNDLNNRDWGVLDPKQFYLFKLDPAQPTPPTDTMPESISLPLNNDVYVAYPLVAQKFELESSDDIGDDEQSVLSSAVKAIHIFFVKCLEGSPRSVLPGLDDDIDTPTH
jgi:hypothetical protein